jgi:membrane protease YdiL (CAAX protease family)/uncharacterized RDD family membrane protein YckC
MSGGTPTGADVAGVAAPGTPGAAVEPEYSALGARTVAALIDNLLWIFGFVFFYGELVAAAAESSLEAAGVLVVIYLTLWFNYFAYCERRWGQTAGKNAVRLRVTKLDGTRPTWNAGAIRSLLRVVDLLLVGPILIATTRRKQRLGDLLAKTIVVQEPRQPSYGAPPPPTAGAWPEAATTAPASPPPAAAAPPPGVQPPPAWYPDPLGHGLRYWDGSSWTSRVASDRASLAAVAGSPSAPVAPAVEGETDAAAAPSPAGTWWAGIPRPGWSAGRVGLGVVALIVLAVIEVVPVAILDPDLESLGAKLATQAMLAITLVGIALGFASGPDATFARPERLGLRRFGASAIGWAFAAFIAYFVFAAVLNALAHTEQEDLARDLGFDVSVFGAVASGVLIVGFAPISEEVFFRGFMFAGLRRRLPLAAAALLSGVIFGLFHLGPGNFAAVGQLAGLGLILCLLYEKTGSLWPSIMLHTVNNAIAFAVLASS